MAGTIKRETKDKNPVTEVFRAKATSIFKRTLFNAIQALYPFIKHHIPPREEYCEEVQEFYDFFNRISERDHGHQKQKWIIIRDFTCWALEYDRAYLMRFLDSLVEMNFEKLKEIWGRHSNRELNQYTKDLSYDFKGKKYEGDNKG